LNITSAVSLSACGHCCGSPSREADQSYELAECADLPEKSIARERLLSKRKEDASYTKMWAGGGTTGNVVAREKRTPAVVKEQHHEQPILQRNIMRRTYPAGQKKKPATGAG
jgi:hypothetical protein